MHAWDLRLRRAAARSRWRVPLCCLPDCVTPSAPCIRDFGAHNFGYPACIYPCPTLQVRPYGRPRMARGQDGSLLLSCMTLSFTTPRRFIPTLSTLKRAPPPIAGDYMGQDTRRARVPDPVHHPGPRQRRSPLLDLRPDRRLRPHQRQLPHLSRPAFEQAVPPAAHRAGGFWRPRRRHSMNWPPTFARRSHCTWRARTWRNSASAQIPPSWLPWSSKRWPDRAWQAFSLPSRRRNRLRHAAR